MVGMKQRGKSLQSQPSRPPAFPSLSQFFTSFSTPISPAYPHITILSSPPIPIPPPQHNTSPPRLPQTPSESLISPYVKNKPYLWVGRSVCGGGWESISARSVESLTVRYQEEGGGPGGRRRGGGVFSTSVFPSVTCCLFDFVLSQDKH